MTEAPQRAGVPRRTAFTALAGAGAAAAGAAALATPAVAEAVPRAGATPRAAQTMTVITQRNSITLPVTPPLGAPFIISLQLQDASGNVIGDGSVNSMVVEIVVGPPATIVTHDKAILRLADGEVHVSTMHERTVPNPGKLFPVAIVGGTGAYSTITGDGTLEYTTAADTRIILNYSV